MAGEKRKKKNPYLQERFDGIQRQCSGEQILAIVACLDCGNSAR